MPITFSAGETKQINVELETTAITSTPAINDMGDLDNDGYVTTADIDILKAYISGQPISSISPLTVWEFVRRADLNCDANIDAYDITAIENFIATGTLPRPVIGTRVAVDGLGDLNNDGVVNSVDLQLCAMMFSYPGSQVTPLSDAEALRRADLNGDGAVNTLDWVAMNQFIGVTVSSTNTGNLPVLAASLLGVVTDADTTAPISSVLVEVVDVTSTSTASDGTYSISGIPAGTYTVRFSHPDYVTIEY